MAVLKKLLPLILHLKYKITSGFLINSEIAEYVPYYKMKRIISISPLDKRKMALI